MKVVRPRHSAPRVVRDDLDDEIWLVAGTISGHDLPFALDSSDVAAERDALDEALDRKRPIGFQADWSEIEA